MGWAGPDSKEHLLSGSPDTLKERKNRERESQVTLRHGSQCDMAWEDLGSIPNLAYDLGPGITTA